MKIVENLVLKACGYTLSILLLFYIAGTISDFTNPFIDFKTFLLILLFGSLISLTEPVFGIKNLHPMLKVLIHYFVLFCAFTATFVISGNIAKRGAAAIFSSLIIFTFFYAIVFTAMYFIRKLIKKADNGLDKRMQSKAKKTKQSEYKSLYTKED